jgi:intracellular sulfur oxidation DsrE/DsrF family protein
MWTRRRLAISGFLAAYGLSKANAAAVRVEDPKVVYHLNDLDRVDFVLRCIRNHYAGMEGEPIALALVIHGAALRAFHKASASLEVADSMAFLVENGIVTYACSNTLRAQGITRSDLVSGFDPAECVGVVQLAQLQARGYAYIRP